MPFILLLNRGQVIYLDPIVSNPFAQDTQKSPFGVWFHSTVTDLAKLRG